MYMFKYSHPSIIVFKNINMIYFSFSYSSNNLQGAHHYRILRLHRFGIAAFITINLQHTTYPMFDMLFNKET